jgi:hypothetical protein
MSGQQSFSSCDEFFPVIVLKKRLSTKTISAQKNLFLCQLNKVQQGRELPIFTRPFIHRCAYLWLHFFGSQRYFRHPPQFFQTTKKPIANN